MLEIPGILSVRKSGNHVFIWSPQETRAQLLSTKSYIYHYLTKKSPDFPLLNILSILHSIENIWLAIKVPYILFCPKHFSLS